MKKNISYRDQLTELSRLYKIDEINDYIKSKKNLTTSQIELILLKNKVRLPEQSYNKKKIAAIRFKEQVITNLVVTVCFLFFIIGLIGVRPHIKTVTNEIKFTHIAQGYKSNFKENYAFPDTKKSTVKKKKSIEQGVSLDTEITLNLFDSLKYDLEGIRNGASVKPIFYQDFQEILENSKVQRKKKIHLLKSYSL